MKNFNNNLPDIKSGSPELVSGRAYALFVLGLPDLVSGFFMG